MPDRDFDKSIQQKANELRLEPSPEVWERVAAQIKEKDRRRGFAWYWLAAAMLAGGLSIWFFGPDLSNSPAPSSITQSSPNDSNTTPSVSNSIDQNRNKDFFSKEQSIASSEQKAESTSSEKSSGITQLPSISGEKNQPVSATTETTNKAGKHLNKASGKPRSFASSGELAAAEKTNRSETQKNQQILSDESVQKELYGRLVNSEINPTVPGEIEPKQAAAGDTKLNSDLLTSVQQPSKTKESWNLAMQIGGGSGSMREGLTTSYAPRFENTFGNIALQPPGTAAALDPRPSEVKAGPSFQASIGLSKPISRKLNFITGIQYAYFSNRIEVGRKIDSSAMSTNFRLQNVAGTAAYTGAGNDGKTYYNAYHYLQIPFEIGWFLDNQKRISWNNGFLFGVLLRTDALHYDQAAGAYFQNNDLVNKFQTSAQTSLNYRLLQLSSGSLSAGPFLNYQLSNIDKTAGNKRLLTVGLNARFLFNKSK